MSIIEDIRPSASSTYMLLPYQDEFIELSLTEAQKIYDEAVNSLIKSNLTLSK